MNNPIILDFGNNSTFFFIDKWYLPSNLANKIKEISDDIKNNYSLNDDIENELLYNNFNPLYGDLYGIIMENIKDDYDFFSKQEKSSTNYVVFDKNQIQIIEKL
jgi:hypothetical protein